MVNLKKLLFDFLTIIDFRSLDMSAQRISLAERLAPTPPNTHFVMLPPGALAVLTQQRTEMEQEALDELASSIKKNGQMYPGIVFAFAKKEADKYLREINRLWGSSHALSDFSPVFLAEKGRSFYLFVVAGHRRLRACVQVKVDYYAQVVFGSNFEKAIAIQLEENFHESVPLGDQIRSAHALWVRAKEREPKLTLRAFSRKIHKSVTWLRKALRFSGLPLSVQRLLSYKGHEAPKGVPYGALLEFANLFDSAKGAITEDRLISDIFHVVAHGMSLRDVRAFCDVRRLEVKGQGALFTLTSSGDVNKRSLAAAKTAATQHVHSAREYLEGVHPVATLVTQTGRGHAEEVIVAGEKVLRIGNH